jgi:hypothetical protein
LTELAARSGGITRENAVDAARASVESLRDLALETIEAAIRAIEAVAYGAKRGALPPEDMKEILMQADHVVTMTATFGLETLECAAKSLCDVADGLMARGAGDAAPILVHVQTLRLLSPGAAPLDEEQTRYLLSELTRVREHFHFAPLSAPAKPEAAPPEAAK